MRPITTQAVSASTAPSFRIPFAVMVAAFCLLWASAFSVAKFAIADCPPLLLLMTRFLLAGVLMLGAAAIYGMKLNLSRRDLAVFAVLGIVNQAAYLGLSRC